MADNTMLMDACLTECEIRKKVLLSILSLVMPCASSVSLPSMNLSANMHFFIPYASSLCDSLHYGHKLLKRIHYSIT